MYWLLQLEFPVSNKSIPAEILLAIHFFTWSVCSRWHPPSNCFSFAPAFVFDPLNLMAGSRDSTSLELSPAAAAIIASAAKELAEQQSMNEALEAQIQEGVQELLRVRQTPSYYKVLSSCLNTHTI